jgi:glucokinase
MFRIGVDLGGTNIAAGLVDGQYRILDRESVKTNVPRPAESIIRDIAGLVVKLCERNGLNQCEIEAVGVGVPGTINEDTGYVEYSNNIRFENVPFIEMLGRLVSAPVHFGNDANAAALGEYLAGGYNVQSFVMVTLGTGVGSGIILDGRLIKGINFAASELGHTVIKMGGEQCTCGRKGCFEAYASATALIRDARRRFKKESTDKQAESSVILKLCGGDMEKLEAKHIFDAAKLGDEAAGELFSNYTEYLAEGIANIINILQPELICIGGGVSKAGDMLLEPVKEKVAGKIFSKNSAKNTDIKLARLDNDAGIIGAALL